MEKILIAYCRDNMDLARMLEEQLGLIGISFDHLTNVPGTSPGQFADALQKSTGPVMLIVTDNLLKSLSCMTSISEVLKGLYRANRVVTIVADGIRIESDGQKPQKVSTRFDRVIHAIQYINHWQSAYQEVNEQYERALDSQKHQVLERLNATKQVSDSIGEIINTLKDGEYFTWDEFKRNHFELFFQKFSILDWHKQFITLSQRTVSTPITSKFPGPGSPVPTQSPKLADEYGNGHEGVSIATPVTPLPHLQNLPQNNTFTDDQTPSLSHIKAIIDDIEAEEEQQQYFTARAAEEPHARTHEDAPVATRATDAIPQDYVATVKSQMQRIKALIQLGEITDGIDSAKTLHEQNQNDDAIRYFYAQILAQHSDQVEAVNAHILYLQKMGFPDDKLKELKGDLAFKALQVHHAKEWWEIALEDNPESADVHMKLGHLLETYFKGAKRTAAQHYRTAADLLETDPEPHIKYANILLEYLDKPKKATKQYQHAVNLAPQRADAWYGLSLSAYHSDQMPLAADAYRRAVALDPKFRSESLDRLFAGHKSDSEQAVKLEESRVVEPEVLTVLITGASSGIGQATARLLASNGHRLILSGRRTERLESLRDELQLPEDRALLAPFDVRDLSAVQAFARHLPEAWRNIDVLLNNAGLAQGLSLIHEGDIEEWDTMIDTNIKGLLYMTRAIAPFMVERGKGHIVNISSSAGKEVYPKGNVYCATKWAVEALTKGMRLDLHQYGIRVSQVSPGHVEETEFALTRFHGDTSKSNIYSDFQPLKASDVADAINYIITRPPHVNVQDIHLFGTQQASSTVIDRSGRKF